ncbi:energy-coupling factor transporter transmembrane protein EcfT [Corynebacterium sp. MSK008]|uniref:energy-coupling factor transporter transmembrane component T family protein n=1 Tax=Corynebacterium sp. MSK008 TaxID=3050188 RepID=UPI00254FA908|nr:energy-coupling factor transporter transmembrane protein EcfT [Corynebacterium sp. MSK008]MDK8878522.1 energy-coupling factor transporter transmembrane protein EcfT [Corynebacterium sp. MSK008]
MIRELPLGVYIPGDTWLHRLGAALKFVLLVVFIIAVTALPTQPWHASAALGLVALLYVWARIPARVAWRQLMPLLPVLLFLGVFMVWQNGVQSALTLLIGLLATIAAANLLTLTTPVEALMDALDRALAPLGRAGELTSLTIALTIRLIPLMLATANEVLDARKARGSGFSLRAFGTPLVIRSVRRARMIGEALMARGAVD